MMPVVHKKHGIDVSNTAEAFLEILSLRGIDCFFGNAGTDFASVVEAFARRKQEGKITPRPVTVPHEIPLIGMAHGYYLVTGRVQAAMVHVGVGTANGIGPVMNASRAGIPIFFCAGRTPITEKGHPASRSAFIHWAQESFDQAGILREYVKWDYELRNVSQLEEVVDRALLLATSDPKGPVYLTLPRELLYTPFKQEEFNSEFRYDLPTSYPDPEKIARAAKLIAESKAPLIITSSVGRSSDRVKALTRLAESWNIGVVSFNPEYMNFPAEHYCHQGFSPDPFSGETDLVIVIDSDVPWYPSSVNLSESAKIINIGVDPFYGGYPVRSFCSDITIKGDSEIAVNNLCEVLSTLPFSEKDMDARKKRLEKQHGILFDYLAEIAEKASADIPLDPAYVSSRVNRILDDNSINVNEYDNQMIWQANHRPGGYFGVPHAGYLGWGIGAALGVKMAAPKKTVIATVGDGSYMFSVPSACHFVSSAHNLPILVIIYNNREWNAVKQSALGLHPDGWVSRAEEISLVDLTPSPDFEQICRAFGGYGEKVERPDQIDGALERALNAVKNENRQACLNVICR